MAHLASLVGAVEHRSHRGLTWGKARAAMALHNRDALKTGRGASAEVAYSSGGKLSIEEQSLVIIEAPAPGPGSAPGSVRQVARIERGTLRGTVKAGDPALRVVTSSGKAVEIKPDGDRDVPYRVRLRAGGKLEVAVLKGSAQVSSGGQQVQVEANQVVDIAPQGPRQPVKLPPFPTLEVPPVDGQLEAGEAVLLSWKPVDAASRYRVQVSRQMSFEPRLVDKRVNKPQARIAAPKPDQTYFWRVSSMDAAGREGEFGFARRFQVLPARPVEQNLLAPPDRARFVYMQKPDPVIFRWKGDAARYLLVVARDPAFKDRVVQRKTRKLTATVRGLHTGRYYWGVYALTPEGQQALFVRPQSLISARRSPPGVSVPRSIGW